MAPNKTITGQQLAGLKREAKILKRSIPGLTHSVALDQIANRFGYENWSILSKSNSVRLTSTLFTDIQRNFTVRISGWVLTHDANDRGTRKFWHINLPTRYQASHYTPFRRVPENWDVKGKTLEHTIRRMEQLRMNIAFMDVTELRPSKAFKSLFPDYGSNAGLDHFCVWLTADKNYVVSNEPYRGSEKYKGTKIWCEENGWTWVELPKGIGMHNTCAQNCPDNCIEHTALILMSPPKRKANLKTLVEALNTHFHKLNEFDVSPNEKSQG